MRNAGLLDVWDFRSRFAVLQRWEVPPTLEALQAAMAASDGQPAVMLELLRPLLLDVRSLRPPALHRHCPEP